MKSAILAKQLVGNGFQVRAVSTLVAASRLLDTVLPFSCLSGKQEPAARETS